MIKKTQAVGVTLLIGGIILIYLYSAFHALQNIDIASVPIAIIFGAIAIFIGAVALLISVFYEQKSDMKKRREEIPKEDFEP